MSNKDEILANFQACTGIEDYGKAFTYLESCEWDLHMAINKVVPDEHTEDAGVSVSDQVAHISSFSTSFSTPPMQRVDVINTDSPLEEIPIPIMNSYSGRNIPSASAQNEPSVPSSSQPQPPVFDIKIQIINDGRPNGNFFPLEIPSSTTVGELQTILHQLVGIPPCSQFLEGFEKPTNAHTVITSDLLPKNMSLSLNTTSSSFNPFEKHNGSVSDEITLRIRDEKNGKDYRLYYPLSKRVNEIKTDVFHFSGIPVRHQLWVGWPQEIEENTTLSSLGITNDHHLSVSQQPQEKTPKSQRKVTRPVGDASEENSSADEFEDASELLPDEDFLIMCDVPSSQTCQPLIPPNVEDEITGVLHFVEQFQNRYGTCTPLFYHGTLINALKESVMLPAKNRKPLAVYLHHDKSVSANVFCSQSLCHVSVVDYLTNNFVIWGWDLTHDSNKSMLLNLISSNFGVMACSTVRSYSLEKLPALLIINRSRGAIEILSVIHGNAILDEVMTSLLQANEFFEEQRKAEMAEEALREQRETMMAEQDAAYHASLEADRAKAQAKRRAELEEQVERERQQSIKEQEDAIREAVRASLEEELPSEPGPDCSEATSTLRFRVPEKEPFSRVFTKNSRLQMVLNYLCVKGYPPDEFKYIQSWPRRCLTSLDAQKTLEQIGMPNQETITVEERTDHD